MDLNIPEGYYSLLAKIESGNNPNAKNENSSASGLYQFVRSTWEGLGYAWRDVFNPVVQNEAIRKFTADNAKSLSGAGVAINEASLYAAHFRGASTATKALGAADDTPISRVGSSAAIPANSFLRGMSVGQFKDWLKRKTGVSVSANPTLAAATQEAVLICPHCQKGFLIRLLTKSMNG